MDRIIENSSISLKTPFSVDTDKAGTSTIPGKKGRCIVGLDLEVWLVLSLNSSFS